MKRFGPYVVLFLGVVLAFGSVLLPSHILQLRDHRAVFYGRWWWVTESLSNFTLPSRTLAASTNVPLEALLNGTYTPMTAIFFLFDFEVAYDIFVAAHVFLTCAGIYVLARSLGATTAGATVAGAFGLAGPIISFENLLVGLQGFAWIPWTLWAVHRFLVTRNVGWIGGVAMFAGFHVQAIMPETAMLDGVAAAILIWWVRPHVKIDVSAAVWLVIGALLGLAIGAVELMPVLIDLSRSVRGAGFSSAEANVWAVHPPELLELAFPVFFHQPDLPFVQYEPMLGHRSAAPYLFSLYLGLGIPVGLAAAFTDEPRARRAAIFVLGLGLLFLLTSLGTRLPFYGWMQSLPVMKNGRYPCKLTVHVTAALAAVAPAGYEALRRRGRATALLFVPGLLLALAALRALSMPEVQELIASSLRPDPAPGAAFSLVPSDYAAAAIEASKAAVWHTTIFSALALLVVSGAQRVKGLWPLIIGLLVADLGIAAQREIVSVGAEPGPPPELVAKLSSPHYRYYSVSPGARAAPVTLRDGETPMEAQLRDGRARCENLLGYARPFDDRNNDAQSHPASVLAYVLVQRARGPSALKILARAGVTHVASYKAPPGDNIEEFPIEGGVPQYVLTVPNARKYVEVHPKWRKTTVEKMETTEAAMFVMDDFLDLAFVSTEGVGSSTVTTSSAAAACRRNSSVKLIEDDDLDRIEIEADLACHSMVSVLEVHMPAWRATLNGKDVPIHDLDFAFLSVEAPKGRHRIVFTYEGSTPEWARLSLAAALIAFGLVGLGVRRLSGRSSRESR